MGYSAEAKKEIALYEEELLKSWNKKLIEHSRKVKAIEKPNARFPDTVKCACEKYFDICETDGVKPSVAGLGVALGVSREILLSWVRGEISVECADVIKEYFALIEIFDETALKDNRTNAVSGIFLMKNNHGYKDEVVTKVVDDREISNEEIEQRYRQLHEIVSDQSLTIVDDIPKVENKTRSKTNKEKRVQQEKLLNEVAKSEEKEPNLIVADDVIIPF